MAFSLSSTCPAVGKALSVSRDIALGHQRETVWACESALVLGTKRLAGLESNADPDTLSAIVEALAGCDTEFPHPHAIAIAACVGRSSKLAIAFLDGCEPGAIAGACGEYLALASEMEESVSLLAHLRAAFASRALIAGEEAFEDAVGLLAAAGKVGEAKALCAARSRILGREVNVKIEEEEEEEEEEDHRSGLVERSVNVSVENGTPSKRPAAGNTAAGDENVAVAGE